MFRSDRLLAHWDKSTGDLPYSGSQSPRENTERVAQVLLQLRQYLAHEPFTFNAAFDFHYTRETYWPNMRQQLIIDLFYVHIRNQFREIERERRAFENPLHEQAFVRTLSMPPGTPSVMNLCGQEGFDPRTLPVRSCICVHSADNYARYPTTGELTEQLCIMEWQSKKVREEVKQKHSDWWRSASHTQVQQAVRRGELSNVEHWELVLDRWEPETKTAEESHDLPSRLRRFLQGLLP